jgi:GTP cyclohydrolase I
VTYFGKNESIPISRCTLISLGIGTKSRRDETEQQRKAREEKIAEAVKTILSCLGEDPEREGLLKTPDRYASALMFFTRGYEQSIKGREMVAFGHGA